MRRLMSTKLPYRHITAVEDCLRLFNLKKATRFLFIVDAESLVEMVQRAGHALEALGYPALFSHTLGQVTLGKNEKKDGSGFCISYVALNEDTLDRIRGHIDACVINLATNYPQHLQEHYIEALGNVIGTMKSVKELEAA